MTSIARPRLLALASALVGLVLLVAACGSGGASPSSGSGGDTVNVVATTTIFADMVRQVGGDRVRVESLVPKGGEVHTFDPKPSDVRRVTEADLIVRNGLALDDWLASLVQDAGTSAPVIELGKDLAGATLLTTAGGDVNPHLWMNVAYGSLYAARIAEALTAVDPAGSQAYAEGLAAYQARLAALDADAKARVGSVPEGNRTVVAFHDAFPYFAAAYGLTIDGTVVASPGQDPSAATIAELIATIRDKNVKAIFAEAQFSDEIVRTIAEETGATVVSSLYTDSVGDAPQDTYESMMRWNVDQVVEALAKG